MTGASAQWSTFLQPRPWPIGQTSAKTSSLRKPAAQDLALKKIQIHPILDPKLKKVATRIQNFTLSRTVLSK